MFYNEYLESTGAGRDQDDIDHFVGLIRFRGGQDRGLKVVNWAEILSLTNAQNMKEYPLVSKFNNLVWTAERGGNPDNLALRVHTKGGVTVIQAIYAYLGQTRLPDGDGRRCDENLALLIQNLCQKLLPGAVFLIEKRSSSNGKMRF